MHQAGFALDRPGLHAAEEVRLQLDRREARRALRQVEDAAVTGHRIGEADHRPGVEITVRREVLLLDGKARLQDALAGLEELDAEQAGEAVRAGFLQVVERDIHRRDPTLGAVNGEKLIVENRRARHEYHLSDRVEAGVVLQGTEVKSLRGGKATLQQAYAEVRDGEAWLLGLHVPEYTEGNRANHEPDRPRKLLLHRKEIERLASGVAEKGFTVVPTKLYFKGGRVKVELALGKGKELRDKRRDIAARDAKRQIERELKSARR